MNRNIVSEIRLFDRSLNNLSFASSINVVGILYFYTDIVLIKQCVEPELTRI